MIYKSLLETKIGNIGIATLNGKLIKLSLTNAENDIDKFAKKLGEESIFANYENDKFIYEIQEYLNGNIKGFTFEIELIGTDFQKKVWKALMEIPYGKTKTYKDIAEIVDSPRAYRAVGLANNKNNIPIIIPCHRVIGSNKSLVGFAGGLEMKIKLLEIEGINWL